MIHSQTAGEDRDGHKKHDTDDGHGKYRGIDLAVDLPENKGI